MFEVVRMWLQDFAADMLTHLLDVLAGTAGRACRGSGVDSPFLWVFTRLGFSEAELRAARTGRGNDKT